MEAAYRLSIRARRRRYLALLAEVADALEAEGIEYWLDWGTLLGAWREGALLPHDTDLDLAVAGVAPARLREALERRLRGRLAVRVNSDGIFVRPSVHPRRHTLRDEIRLGLEVIDEGPAEGVARHPPKPGHPPTPIPLALIRPLGALFLGGRVYPAPARPAAYLETLYGYTGRRCVFEGEDRYRPCRGLADHAFFYWNELVFYRAYIVWKSLPVPRTTKAALERWAGPLYRRLLREAKT